MEDQPAAVEIDRVRRSRLARAAAIRLDDAASATLGGAYVREKGAKADFYVDGIIVSSFTLMERCPRRLANPAADYADTTFTTRRRLGLLVMRRLSSSEWNTNATPVSSVVSEVLSDREDWPRGLSEWVEQLDHAALAVLHAAVLTWCVGALRLVGVPRAVTWSDPRFMPKADLPGRLVRIQTSIDAVIGTPASGERILILSDSPPSPVDRIKVGFAALVKALGSGAAPERVSIGSPAAGTMRRWDVTEELLDLTVDRVTEALASLTNPDSAQAIPGRYCLRCHLLDVCSEGEAWASNGGESIWR